MAGQAPRLPPDDVLYEQDLARAACARVLPLHASYDSYPTFEGAGVADPYSTAHPQNWGYMALLAPISRRSSVSATIHRPYGYFHSVCYGDWSEGVCRPALRARVCGPMPAGPVEHALLPLRVAVVNLINAAIKDDPYDEKNAA